MQIHTAVRIQHSFHLVKWGEQIKTVFISEFSTTSLLSANDKNNKHQQFGFKMKNVRKGRILVCTVVERGYQFLCF